MQWEQRRPVFVLAVLFEGSLIGAAWLLGWLLGQPPLARFRWHAGQAALGVAAAIPMTGLFLVFLRWPVGPFARIRAFLEEFIVPLFERCTLIELAIISLVAGVGEEMLFRGVLQGAFSGWFGAAAGLVAASILFGLAHLVTAAYAIVAGLIGVYLGWLWQATGNLMVPITAHAAYDFVAFVCLIRLSGNRRQPASDHDEPPSPGSEE